MSKFTFFQNIFCFPSYLSMLFFVFNLLFPIYSIFIHKSYLFYRTSPMPEMNSFPKLTFCANIGLVYGQTSALNSTTFINKIIIQTDIEGGAWMGKYQQQIGLQNPVMSISCNKYAVDLDPDQSPLLYISIKTSTLLYVYKFSPQLYLSPISLLISPIPMPYPYQFHEQSMALQGNTFAIAYSNKNITVYRIEQPQKDQGKQEGKQRERDWEEGERIVSLGVIDVEGKCGNSTVRIIFDHLGRLAIVCQIEVKSGGDGIGIRRWAKFMLFYGERYDAMVEADQDVDASIPTSYVWNRLVYQRYWDVGYDQANSQQSNLKSYPPDYSQSIFFLRFQQSYSSSFKYIQFSTSSSPTPLVHSSASPQKQGMQFFCQHKGYAKDITLYCYQGIGTVWTGCYDIKLNQYVLTGTCTQVPSVIPMADDQVVIFVLSNGDYNFSQIVYVDAFREAYVVTWIGITLLGLFLGLAFMVCQAAHCDMFEGFQKRFEGQV